MSSSLNLFALLALVLAVAHIASAVNCAADFNNCNSGAYQGTCDTDFPNSQSYCSCRSGYSGNDCSTAIQNCDGSFQTLNATKTEFPPVSVSVYFDANKLNVAIASPLVTQRNFTVIAIDNSSFANENCTYPGPYWNRSFSNCNDIFQGSMPWSDNVACGWAQNQDNSSFAIYSSEMVIRHHDFSVPFGSRPGSAAVERIVDHVVPLTIFFPKNITVDSSIVVQAPIKVIMAVSRQNVSADGEAANIELTTNVLWPYRLTTFSINTNPGGVGASYTPSLVSEVCTNDGTSSCTQVWRIAIVTGDNCNLNGGYTLGWTITCQQVSGVNPPQCAINTGDVANATLTTISESYCSVISTILPLTGSLASYQDEGITANKTQFLVGQTLYYRASVVASNITLTGTTINSVKLTSGGQATVILRSGLVTNQDVAASFTLGSTTASTADFHFTLAGSFIDNIPDDSSRTFSTVVIVDVDYLNAVTLKRGTQRVEFTSPLNTQTFGLSASFTATNPPSDGSSASTLGLASAFLAIIFAMLF